MELYLFIRGEPPPSASKHLIAAHPLYASVRLSIHPPTHLPMNASICLPTLWCLQAIVRYASASYTESTSADARASFLTNTFVGKQQTGGGVGAITGSLAELGEHLAPQV